jgi:hypothetical protein
MRQVCRISLLPRAVKGRCQVTEWQHRIWLCWKALIRRLQLDRDLAEELQFRLAMAEEKRQAEGLAPEEARTVTRSAGALPFGVPSRITK